MVFAGQQFASPYKLPQIRYARQPVFNRVLSEVNRMF